MVTMNEEIKNAENKAEFSLLRASFYKTRVEYELGLRKYLFNKVHNCPGCFRRLFNESRDFINQEISDGDFVSDELSVLEEMLFRIDEKSEEVNDHEIH
jgi:hypothetical protein